MNNVDECKEESDLIPVDARDAFVSGVGGSVATIGGALHDNGPAVGSGLAALGYSVSQVAEIVAHFNNAKHAQKNAEMLFEEL